MTDEMADDEPDDSLERKHWSLYPGYSWTLRLGTFERCAEANPDGGSRFVNIENCTIARGGSIGDRKFFEEVFSVTAREYRTAESRPIGGFNTSRCHINLNLPPPVFDQIWTAAEKTDGMWRRLSFGFQVEDGRETDKIFPVIDATLSEGFADEDRDIKYDDKTGLVRLVRPQRPPFGAELLAGLKGVVTEVRVIQRSLFLIAAIGVVLVIARWLK